MKGSFLRHKMIAVLILVLALTGFGIALSHGLVDQQDFLRTLVVGRGIANYPQALVLVVIVILWPRS